MRVPLTTSLWLTRMIRGRDVEPVENLNFDAPLRAEKSIWFGPLWSSVTVRSLTSVSAVAVFQSTPESLAKYFPESFGK